ncbi:hypothetical protein AgCh_032650 [Apium graveolens]
MYADCDYDTNDSDLFRASAKKGIASYSLQRGKELFISWRQLSRGELLRADKQKGNSALNDDSGCDIENAYEAMGSYLVLKRRCLKVYQEERAKVMQTMENLDGFVALSLDILRRDTYDYHSYELPEGRTLFDYL